MRNHIPRSSNGETMSALPENGQQFTLNDENLAALLTSGSTELIRSLGNQLLGLQKNEMAKACFKRLSEIDRADVNARFVYAQLLMGSTHKSWAEARDVALAILDDFPEMQELSTEGHCTVMRFAAYRCTAIGPNEKGVELFRKLAHKCNLASDYFWLSELLAHLNDTLPESIAALEKAMTLDPTTYDTVANRDTLLVYKSSSTGAERDQDARRRRKIGRYPKTRDFHGDLTSLIKNHIAFDLRNSEKFINKHTRFFTMGSCFARNISRALNQNGYVSNHMEISEAINTTFANRAFVDFLAGDSRPGSVSERIRELLPPNWSAENTLQLIRTSDVFVITLGVAPAFFDRTTAEFVLPRHTLLNSRALAEKFRFRTTSVQENVDNVLYFIKFIRSLSNTTRIVITVSPVPLQASFEFESCVVADCLSKSTMRLTAHEVVNNSGLDNIVYWPSFEIFRWAGSSASSFYAADDGAAWHVSEEKVNQTISAFIDVFKA